MLAEFGAVSLASGTAAAISTKGQQHDNHFRDVGFADSGVDHDTDPRSDGQRHQGDEHGADQCVVFCADRRDRDPGCRVLQRRANEGIRRQCAGRGNADLRHQRTPGQSAQGADDRAVVFVGNAGHSEADVRSGQAAGRQAAGRAGLQPDPGAGR